MVRTAKGAEPLPLTLALMNGLPSAEGYPFLESKSLGQEQLIGCFANIVGARHIPKKCLLGLVAIMNEQC